MNRLLTYIEETPMGGVVEVEDLAECCDTIEQLSEATLLAHQKQCRIIAHKQPWFRMDALPAPVTTIVIRLAQLEKQMRERIIVCIRKD